MNTIDNRSDNRYNISKRKVWDCYDLADDVSGKADDNVSVVKT